MLIGGYAIVELLGLPLDIFNLVMAVSENSIGIAQGLTAPILNWVYMVINFVVMIVATYFLVASQLSVESIGTILISLLLFNVPGYVLLFTQINALLFIYEANEGKDLITDVIFA